MFSTPRKTQRCCHYNPYANNAHAFSLPRPRYTNLFANTYKIALPKPNPVPETPRFAYGPRFEKPPFIPVNPIPPYSPITPSPRKLFGLNLDDKPRFEKPPPVPVNLGPPYSPFPPPPRKRFGHNLDDKPPSAKPPLVPVNPVHPPFLQPPTGHNLDDKPKPFAFFPEPGPKRTGIRSLRRLKSFKLRPPGQYGRIRVRAPYIQPSKRPIEDRGQLNRLDAEIDRVFDGDILDPEDQIFLREMSRLNMNRAFRTNIRTARLTADRALAMKAARIKRREERDALLEKKREKKRLREEALRLEEQRKKREQEVLRERLRLLDEQMNKEREERMQRAREERERWERERAARREAEAKRQEEEQRKEAARIKAEQEAAARAADVDQLFAMYDWKWKLLKGDLVSITFADFPWPVLDFVAHPDDITYLRVKEFVFHLSRSSQEGKNRKDRVRAEMLKWHPDKFNTKLPKVTECERGAVREAAGRVARFLNQMMEGIEMEVQGMCI